MFAARVEDLMRGAAAAGMNAAQTAKLLRDVACSHRRSHTMVVPFSVSWAQAM